MEVPYRRDWCSSSNHQTGASEIGRREGTSSGTVTFEDGVYPQGRKWSEESKGGVLRKLSVQGRRIHLCRWSGQRHGEDGFEVGSIAKLDGGNFGC